MPGFARHTPTLSGDKAVRILTVDTALLPDLGDAITTLTNGAHWVEVGDSVEDVLVAARYMVDRYYAMPFIGSVQLFLAVIPVGWLLLDGDVYDKADYPELHAVLPSQMKTSTEFTLPDMSEVFPQGVTTEGDVDSSGGENVTNLTVAQLAAHTHTYTPPVLTINAETPVVPIPTAGIGAPTNTGSTGSGDDIENRPAFVGFFFAVFAGR